MEERKERGAGSQGKRLNKLGKGEKRRREVSETGRRKIKQYYKMGKCVKTASLISVSLTQ